MENYQKPAVLANEDISEGVYAASGADDGQDCYDVDAYIHQWPQPGRGDYRIQVSAKHAAGDNHHATQQRLVLSFNLPVIYKSSNGSCVSGEGSSIEIDYSYHSNAYENIGLGDVVVEADPGLEVTGAVLYCNRDCYHT